jgi:DNA-directed RNA polymerase II subunit RPB7
LHRTVCLALQRELVHTIRLHPSYFGAQLEDYVKQRLYEEVEGVCDGKSGCVECACVGALLTIRRYIITVTNIKEIGNGKIQPGTGEARFKVAYEAIVMKPFKGEVVEAKVSNVNKVCQPFST